MENNKKQYIFSIFNESTRTFIDTVYINAENYDKAVELLKKSGYLDEETSYTTEVPLF